MKDNPLAVLFDWDNTLVDTQDNINNAISYTISAMGYSNKIVDESFHASRKDYMISLFGNQWEKANKIYQQYLDDAFLQNITLNPGVEEMLKKLKSYSIYTAIVSNKKNTNLRKEVSYFKLDNYLDKIVGSGDTHEDKPYATPVFCALDKSLLPINEKNVFFIGDSITDILCAQNANCLPIVYSQSPITNYADLLYFQCFDKLTSFIVQYLEKNN
jgi:phosphoglycolate phosphatase